MRSFSTVVQTILAQDSIIIAYCVRISQAGVTILANTTAASDITFNSITYDADGGLVTVEAPRLSSAVDRETYKIGYIDPEFTLRSLFETGMTGYDVVVNVIFFNNTASPVVGTDTVSVAPGAPFLAVADSIVAYSGVVDTQGYAISPKEGTVVATVECSSPMASLGLTRAFFTSRDSLRRFSRTDSAFDKVYIGSQQVKLQWGRK